MEMKALTERIEEISRNLGLSESVRARLVSAAVDVALEAASTDSRLTQEVSRLRTEVHEARSERDRMAVFHSRVITLLHSQQASNMILHQVRNLFNNLVLDQAVDARSNQETGPQGLEAIDTVDAGDPRIFN
jgi:hypothetical protein